MTLDNKVTSPKEVFFSYSSKDRAFVSRVYDDLNIRGVTSIWMDKRVFETGDEWEKEIEKALQTCTHMVIFITRNSLNSEWVRREYTTACQRVPQLIRVVPLIINNEISTVELSDKKFSPLNSREVLSINEDTDYSLQLSKLVKVLPQRKYFLPEMAFVQDGLFAMGPQGEWNHNLDSFWIARHPVTIKEFNAFVQAGGLSQYQYWVDFQLTDTERNRFVQPDGWPPSSNSDMFNGYALNNGTLPMTGINWFQAQAYCKWLNYVTESPAHYNFRLPNELEWEKAARGTDARSYPWGNHWLNNVANTCESGRGVLLPCGQLGNAGDSPYGCQDMAGNVWEWTQSLARSLPYQFDAGHEQPHVDLPRVIRGGSWRQWRSDARTFTRASETPIPNYYRGEIGFRLVASENPA